MAGRPSRAQSRNKNQQPAVVLSRSSEVGVKKAWKWRTQLLSGEHTYGSKYRRGELSSSGVSVLAVHVHTHTHTHTIAGNEQSFSSTADLVAQLAASSLSVLEVFVLVSRHVY